MPHIVRFSIFRQEDIDLSLSICRRLGITPEDFARSAFFENIEEAARLIKEREERAKDQAEAEMSAEAKAKAEADLGVTSTGEEEGASDGESKGGNTTGDSAEALVLSDASTSVVAEAEVPAAETASP